MPLRLVLFGAPIVESDGQAIAIACERRTQMLAFLALRRAWVPRAELAALLWPELAGKLAFANLRKTLFRLQALPWAGAVEAEGNAVRFAIDTDVLAFAEALREKRLDDALAAYRGTLCTGFDDDDNEPWTHWLRFERERLQSAWRAAALERLAGELAPEAALALAARLLEVDPLDEAALRMQMSWLARAGQGARAREAYREFAQRLQADLGLPPGPELRALHDALAASPHPAPTPAPPATLRDEDFVGRAAELRAIATRLATGNDRLLCLVGPGGVGKTRLARRALADLAPRFAGGTLFVSLVEAPHREAALGNIAQALGVPSAGMQDALDRVAQAIGERHFLLVLDNLEHLADAPAWVAQLVDRCPQLRLLVTSRVRIDATRAWHLPLDGLPCPEGEDADRLEAFDAVRLFLRAARRFDPALDARRHAAAIADICRRVDGLPLALELAAAWARVIDCTAIAAELARGIELLRAGDAASTARHAGIDTVFDQSWRLLGPREQEVLPKLALFRGGFTAEAARAVCAAPLPLIGALVDKSLLRRDGARLAMHPLVQQLAEARLEEGAAQEAARQAHAAYYTRLMTQLVAPLRHGDRDALQTMDAEFENCRAAWAWAAERRDGGTLSRCAVALREYCDHRGRLNEGLRMLQDALDSLDPAGDDVLRGRLLSKIAHLEYRLDRYADAEASASAAMASVAAARDPETRLQCLVVLASCALRLGRLDDAKRIFRAQLDAPATPRDAAATLDNLALVEKTRGDYDAALALALRSLALYRRLGDHAGEALCLNNLGDLYMAIGDDDAAATHLRDALVICDREGLASTRSLVLANLSLVAMNAGDDATALAYTERALGAAQAAGHRAVICWAHMQQARLAVRRRDTDAARASLAAAIALALAIGRPTLQIAVVQCFAEILHAQGERAAARQALAFALAHPFASSPQRKELAALLDTWQDDAPPLPWPDIDVETLVHRIAAETALAYAPLLAVMRGRR